MAVALKLSFVILSFAVFGRADVSHLGYRRYSGQRVQPLRLQRLESDTTPYPAAGYRPNREFNLPREQPLFPLANHQSPRPQVSSGFDSLSEPQRPQLFYGSPVQEPRFIPRNRPQNFNGFNNLAEPQQHGFVGDIQQPTQSQNSNRDYNNVLNNSEETGQSQNSEVSFNNFEDSQNPQSSNSAFDNGFNNLAESQQPQQRPELIYGAPPNNREQQSQSGFDNLSEPQYNNNVAPARLRQQLFARLQRAQRLQQLQQQNAAQDYRQSQSRQQQVFNSPQSLYRAPSQQTQIPAESQSSRLIAQKPARLTDNREETDEESDAKTSETVEEIETTTKAEVKKPVNGTVPVVANTNVVSYYPATAFGFVQPLSATYVTSANYQTVQPISAAYTVGSPFLPHQYTLAAAAPAQLQAW